MPIGIVAGVRTCRGEVTLNCTPRSAVCIPRGDAAVIDFPLYDDDGDEFDTGPITAARFIVSEGQEFAGNILAGGDIYVELTLGAGITKLSDDYTLRVTLTPAQTALIDQYRNYMQLQINVGASRYTVASGLYLSEFTQ